MTEGQASAPLSILTITTLFPNPAQPAHGSFVETRLRKLIETGEITSRVLAPIPWMPRGYRHHTLGPVYLVPRQLTRRGIPVEHPRYLVIPKIGMTLTPATLFRALRWRLAAMLRDGYRPDLIDAHYFYPDGVAAVRLGRVFGLPVVVTARGTDLNLIPDFRRPREMIQRAAAAADGLITVCEALRERLIALGTPAERVLTLRNGVDLALFCPIDRAAVRARWGFHRRTLASVGHLVERKGHHHVIRALADLPDTDLVIVGGGPDRGAMEALAQRIGVADRVRFLGVLDQDTLREIYGAADALVLASSREGWANVLLEAMACGTPVVASAVWGTPEVVASPAAGVLMRTLDPSGVFVAVNQLFAALPDRHETRAYAEQFDWRPTTEGQLKLFRQILAARNQPNNSA